MVLNTRHTGIVTTDIDRAQKFYEGLGMKLISRQIEEGPYIDRLVGIPAVKLEWVKLALPDNSILELLQYHSNPGTGLLNDLGVQEANRLGCSHIAFSVSDIDLVSEYVLANGGTIRNNYQISPDGKVKVMYCYDFEGNILEMVEVLH